YGIPERLPITEATTQDPVNPYGHTKLAVERMLRHAEAAHGVAVQVATQGVVSRSAKRAMVLRYTTDRFHSRMTSKFAVPSPTGAPGSQPLLFRRLAVEASTSGTLRRRSTRPSPS